MTENPQKQLILTSIDYHLFHHALEKVKLPICNNKVKDYLIYLIQSGNEKFIQNLYSVSQKIKNILSFSRKMLEKLIKMNLKM